ncbi:MAG: hypothetical protein ACYC06_05115 [Ilumatobacteraceae bacterium]
MTVAGGVILVMALLGFPIVVGMSTAVIAALIGYFLCRDAEIRHEGSELVELNI